MNPIIMLVVTHLQGIGHLTRTAAIGRALLRAGAQVTLVTGGLPVPSIDMAGMTVVQLPPLRSAGTDYRRLLDQDSREATAEHLAARRAQLLNALRETRPAVVVAELFPFGRRILAPEFTALFEAMAEQRPRPALAISLRDVVEKPSKPARVPETGAILARHDATVLVHGDPAVLPLERSWPVGAELASRLAYTGYVADDRVHGTGSAVRLAEVVVSSGGGVLGEPLRRAALAAAPLLPGLLWRILAGRGGVAPAAGALPENVRLEPFREDFPALLRQAAVSVSRAGYNTMLDVAQSGIRAVVVPHDNGKEVEQIIRAAAFEQRGWVHVLPEAALSGSALASSVAASLDAPAPAPVLDLAGAGRSAVAILALAAAGTGR
jgi:predicted glycosyltransferase